MVREYFKLTKITKENLNQLLKIEGKNPFKDLLIKMHYRILIEGLKNFGHFK